MQATPLFLGACAFASIAGVVSGTAIDTRPIQRGGIGMDEIARPAIAFDASDNGLSDQVAMPDHYALNTPQGEFGVEELAMRGLYDQRRFAWRDAQWTAPPEPAFAEPQADPEWSASAADLALGIAEAPSTPKQGQAVSDQAKGTEPAATQPPIGQARMIDVQVALADQNS